LNAYTREQPLELARLTEPDLHQVQSCRHVIDPELIVI